MDSDKSTRPQPNPVTIEVEKSALLVLDGSQRWGDPALACHRLVPPMKTFKVPGVDNRGYNG